MNDHARELLPFPVLLSPELEESALGFLLRSACANGSSLYELRELIQLRRLDGLNSTTFRLLAYMVQVSPTWLASRSAVRARSDGSNVIEFARRRWTASGALRLARPQVCPQCMRLGGSCAVAWEVSAVCACSTHGCLLLDRCPRCQQFLSWMRPAVEVCGCGGYLVANSEPGQSCELDAAIELSSWLAGTLDLDSPPAALPTWAPRWFEALSPDGVHAILSAFGMAEKHLQQFTPVQVRTVPEPRQMAERVARAVARLDGVDPLQSLSLDSARGWVNEATLERLAARSEHGNDRVIATQLLAGLSPRGQLCQDLRGSKASRQMDLFQPMDQAHPKEFVER